MRTLCACVCRLQVQVWRIRNLILIGIDSAQLAPELWVIVPSGRQVGISHLGNRLVTRKNYVKLINE